MSNRSGRERKTQEYNMYELFATNERAQKRAALKNADTDTAKQTGASTRPAYRRPAGSSGTTEVRHRNVVPKNVSVKKSESVPTQRTNSDTHRYKMRSTPKVMQRPAYDHDDTGTKRDRNEALFMIKTESGRKVLIRDTSMTELRAVRVPPEIQIKTYKTKEHPFPLGTVLSVLLVTALVMAMIYSYVRRSELITDNAAMDDELASYKDKEADLGLQIVKRADLKDIEQKAENDLGMIKNEQQEKRYVAIEGHDHAEVITGEDEEDIPVQTVILK